MEDGASDVVLSCENNADVTMKVYFKIYIFPKSTVVLKIDRVTALSCLRSICVLVLLLAC